jgi:hypothetical protein
MEKSTQTDNIRQAGNRSQPSQTSHRTIPTHQGWSLCILLLAMTTSLGIALRWLSFQCSSDVLAGSAAMVLFAPASFAAVVLGWGSPARLSLTLKAFLGFLMAFLLWNTVMLPGLPLEIAMLAVKQNLIHWGLFLLCGILSLRFIQWNTGIGIASNPDSIFAIQEPKPSRLNVAKLLALTAACAIGADAMRRLSTHPTSDFASWLTGILGGSLLGIQWSVLAWLWRLRTWRSAGLILWVALAAIVRWQTDALLGQFTRSLIQLQTPANLDDQYYVVRSSLAAPATVQQAMQFVWEAVLQTIIVLAGVACLHAIGYPIRQLRKNR